MRAVRGGVIDHAFEAMGCSLRIAVVPRVGDDPAAVIVGARGAEALIHSAAARLTRFDAASELQQVGADPRHTVGVSPMLALAVDTAVRAAERTAGLLDPTLAAAISSSGYAADWDPARRVPLTDLLDAAPARQPAGVARLAWWREVRVDRRAGTITRPPGTQLDLGATAKGLLADLALRLIGPAELVIVDVGGDLALGGDQFTHRALDVVAEDPFGRRPLTFAVTASSGVATSSIAGRCWLGDDGAPAHHVLDPATGRSAFTGLVQATACAPTAAEAEVLAGWALLAGPARAAEILAGHGGLLVHDDGTTQSIAGDRTTEGPA